jgi:hypothetical protein
MAKVRVVGPDVPGRDRLHRLLHDALAALEHPPVEVEVRLIDAVERDGSRLRVGAADAEAVYIWTGALAWTSCELAALVAEEVAHHWLTLRYAELNGWTLLHEAFAVWFACRFANVEMDEDLPETQYGLGRLVGDAAAGSPAARAALGDRPLGRLADRLSAIEDPWEFAHELAALRVRQR